MCVPGLCTPWANLGQSTAHCPALTLTRQRQPPRGPCHRAACAPKLAGLLTYFSNKGNRNLAPALVSIYRGDREKDFQGLSMNLNLGVPQALTIADSLLPPETDPHITGADKSS